MIGRGLLRAMISRKFAFSLIAALAAAPVMAETSGDPLAALTSDIVVTGHRVAPDSPDVLGTAAIDAGVTIYDVRFRRVSAADAHDPRLKIIADALSGLTPAAQLAKVKLLVARLVHSASDLDTMHVADYWSNASDTLDRGAGDDEDIAIVEMQALKAAGFPTRDLYLSVGREQRRGYHTVLIARTAEGFYLLDDALPAVVPASSAHAAAFTPIMTIGAGRSWLHGYRVHPASATSFASR